MYTRKTSKMERVHDPVTGHVSWQSKEVDKLTLEEDDRISLVLEILGGKTTAEEVRSKYGLVSINSIYGWIGKYVSQTSCLPLSEETEEDMARKSKDEQIRELKALLKQARKEAEFEKLRAKAYDTMIDVAEETFNIPIRKKSGTKR